LKRISRLLKILKTVEDEEQTGNIILKADYLKKEQQIIENEMINIVGKSGKPRFVRYSLKPKTVDKFKRIYNDPGYEIQEEGLYEWKIEDWNQISKENEKYSPEFYVYGNKWSLLIHPNGNDKNNYEYISLYFVKVNKDNDCSVHIPVRSVFFVRNYYDYSNIHYESLPIQYYNKNNNNWGYTILIKTSEINKYLNGYNKCVFGVYYTFYQYGRAQFRNEISSALYDESDKRSIVGKCFYEWKIDDWKGLSKSEKSQAFHYGEHQWKIELYKKGYSKESKGYISIFLKCVNPGSKAVNVDCNFYIRNYDNPECCYYNSISDATYQYNNGYSWGITDFIEKTTLFAKNERINKEIIENNRCAVGVYFQIYEKRDEYAINRDLYVMSNVLNQMRLVDNGNYQIERIERELREKIERELREKIERELREKIERELRVKIEREIREKIARENLNRIQPMNYIPYNPQYPQQPYYPPPSYSPPSYYQANINSNPNPNLNPNLNPNPNPNVPMVNYPPPNVSPHPNASVVNYAPPNASPNPNAPIVNYPPPSTSVPTAPTSLSPNQNAAYVNPYSSNLSPHQNASVVNYYPAPIINSYPPPPSPSNVSTDQKNTSSDDKKGSIDKKDSIDKKGSIDKKN